MRVYINPCPAVKMKDSALFSDPADKGEQIFIVQRMTANQVLQRYAIHILHGDERLAVLLVDLVNGTDVGMVESQCACARVENGPELGGPWLLRRAKTLGPQSMYIRLREV